MLNINKISESINKAGKFIKYNLNPVNYYKGYKYILKLPPKVRTAYIKDLKYRYTPFHRENLNVVPVSFKASKDSTWYQNLVNTFGLEKADEIVYKIGTKEFLEYFLSGKSTKEVSKDAAKYKKVRGINSTLSGDPDEGFGVLLGSAAVNNSGTLSRGSAIPHDLDYKVYSYKANKKPVDNSDAGRKKAYQYLFGRKSKAIKKAPALDTLREMYGDRPLIFLPRYMPRAMVPKTKNNAIYATRMFSFGEPSLSRTLMTSIDGTDVDLFVTSNPIQQGYLKGIGSAEEPLYFKLLWADQRTEKGLAPREKDIKDLENYKPFSAENPIINTETGKTQYAPYYFGDELIDSTSGNPVVLLVETYPGSGVKVPVAMNWRGEFRRMRKGGKLLLGGAFKIFGKLFTTFAPKVTKRLLQSVPTFFKYSGPQHSIKELFKTDGTINLKNIKKIHDEIVKHTGGVSATARKENPTWHPTDTNTFKHTKDVVKRAYQLGYSQEEITAALMHDMGKLVAGEGHGPIGASLAYLIFPDLTSNLFKAIYEHMENIPNSSFGLRIKGVDIVEPNLFRLNENITLK